MNLREVFDTCQEIEFRYAKIYANLSLLLGETDERVAKFWEKMSQEEWQHYILIDFGRSICDQVFGLDTPAEDFNISIDKIFELLEQYEEDVARGDVTQKQGFQIAIDLESTEADQLFMYLASVIGRAVREKAQPYLKNKLSRIQKEMKQHHDHLISAVKKLGRDPELVRRALAIHDHH